MHNLFRIAGEVGLREELRAAFNGRVLASCVGPVCASAATEEGVEAPLCPDPPRLSPMVRQVAARLG